MKGLATTFLFLALVACLPSSSFAFSRHEGFAHWNREATLTLHPTSFPAGSDFNLNAQFAMSDWNAVPGTDFRFSVNSFNCDPNDHSDNSSNCVAFTSDLPAGTLGVTITNNSCGFFGGLPEILCNADVKFNANVSWVPDTNVDEFSYGPPFSFRGVARHEFGHVLGLCHEDGQGRVVTMNSRYNPGGYVAANLHWDDRAGMRQIYPGAGSEIDLIAYMWKKPTIDVAGCASADTAPVPVDSIPTRANTGDSVFIEYSIENAGNVSAGSSIIGFYLSTNNIISTSDVLIYEILMPSFPAYHNATFRHLIPTIPWDVPTGTYFLGICLDHNAEITESREFNNCAVAPGSIFITPGIRDTLQLSTSNFRVNEGGGNAPITITRTGTRNQDDISVTLTTSNGTAMAGSDYTAVSQVVSFGPGGDTTTKTVNIPIRNDATFEGDEFLNLALSAPTGGAALGSPSTGILVITDDDPQPSLSINDVTVTEGNSGTTNAVFTVSLSPASGQTVVVNFSTANGSAEAGSDYVANSGIVAFSIGETTKTITVQVNGDTLNELNETFFVNLSDAANATIADGQGVGTIINDDDPLPSISINDVTVTEGNTGMVNAIFTVSLSSASNQTVTVNFTTADGTATAGSDYVANSGSVTFNPGETSKPTSVAIIGDTVVEANETFFVNLTIATNATIAKGQGVGTIVNDDSPVFVPIKAPLHFDADFDGDGKADIAIYRDGMWFIIRSSDGGVSTAGWGGAMQDIPVLADYDGDGKADFAVYRDGDWFVIRSSDGGVTARGWGGLPQDIPVPADYDGDGKTDIAVYRDGGWYIIRSSDGGLTLVGWGVAQDIPVPADYDGDGKTDIAVYRDGGWYIIRSSDGGLMLVGWE